MASTPLPKAKGASLLGGGITLKGVEATKVDMPVLKEEVRPLSEETLITLWNETAAELGLEDLMKNAQLHLGEKQGVFDVEALTTWFHDDFKSKKMEVLEVMRRKTGMPMLDCKVTPKFSEEEDTLYSPDDKYRAMVEQNPELVKMRKLFPMLDY